MVLNKCTNTWEESTHIIFDETNNGILREGFMHLNLNQHYEDIREDESTDDETLDKTKIMQEPILSLDEVTGKQTGLIVDS